MGKIIETQLRVRFSDTDADGGVYYANYLTYFSIGRQEFLRQAGINLNSLAKNDGLRLVAAEATCRYESMAYFEDLLTVRTQVERLGNSSVVFAYEIVRSGEEGETLIATGTAAQVFVDSQNKPTSMPQWVREALSI